MIIDFNFFSIFLPGGHGTRDAPGAGITRHLITVSPPHPVDNLVLQHGVGRGHGPDDLVTVHATAGGVSSDHRDGWTSCKFGVSEVNLIFYVTICYL